MQVKDPDQAELEFKIIRDINNMDPEVRDRFTAIKVLYDQCNDINDEEEKEHRELELKYEKLYAQVYAKRAALIRGEPDAVSQELVEAFEVRADIFKDGAFPDVEVTFCDTKEIQNTKTGVSGFWLKALCSNNHTSHHVQEKDRPILSYL